MLNISPFPSINLNVKSWKMVLNYFIEVWKSLNKKLIQSNPCWLESKAFAKQYLQKDFGRYEVRVHSDIGSPGRCTGELSNPSVPELLLSLAWEDNTHSILVKGRSCIFYQDISTIAWDPHFLCVLRQYIQ